MKGFVIALLAACALSVSATGQTEIEISEAQARKTLDEMAAQTKKCATIDVTFTAAYENKRTGDKNTCDGTLKVKGEKYVLDVNDLVTYSDEEGISVWQKKHKELDISGHDPEAEGDMTPARLFGAYKDGYRLRMLGDKMVAGVECVEIDLYPLDKKSQIVRLRISLDKRKKQVRQFMQQSKMGETLTVSIKSYRVNMPMDDALFRFDRAAHKDVEIVDLR